MRFGTRVSRLLLADVSGHGESVADIASDLRDLMSRNVNLVNQARFVGELNRQFSGGPASGSRSQRQSSVPFSHRRGHCNSATLATRFHHGVP